MCIVNTEGQVTGNKQSVLNSVADFAPFLARVLQNRFTTDNGMNATSSRSHVAIILNLLRLDRTSSMFTKTSFNLIDLAGSERVKRTKGGENVKGHGVDMNKFFVKFMDLFKGMHHDFTIQEQGLLINMDLTGLLQNIQSATTVNLQGRKYTPPTLASTQTQNFLMGCCDGKSRLGMCICLSRAPQNGLESLESLKFGKECAKLRVPLKNVKSMDIQKAKRKLEMELVEAEADLANSNTSIQKFHQRR
eukprot:CAMPEP_0175132366 /NCGR_PEP_ID=MMETSP0087-20121206/7036_1 /TAXON_ID=136419 /ORGANISM="Unknown Unknown, Strain D1" /LENGTH=247 /DNA_ID=CAMNT_0016414715 /DNA_START=299 /DNA_END=1038 /DNA_ORIENTATION=-